MIIQTIVQIGVIGMAAFAGFGIGWIYRNETWTPRPHRAGKDIDIDFGTEEFFDTWEQFQEKKRSDEVDALTIIEWEQEIKDTRVN